MKNKHMLKEYRESEKMVYRRFLVLALGLLFVINAIWGSCAHDYHDWEMKKKKETVGIGENTVSVHKELLSGFSTARTRKMDLGGKKMAAQKESRGTTEKEKGFHGKASEDNSGANYSSVKCDFQVKGSGFNVRCKRGDRKKSPKTRRGPGFVAFGDDYRGPKQHPPKHN